MAIGNRYNQHSFAEVPDVNIGRSSFDRSYAIKDSFDFDTLIPIYLDEVIPGDTHNMNLNCFARLATQLVPIMDNMYVDFFFFFVPNRLVYSNWEKLCGAQDNPGDSIDFVMPSMTPGAAFAVDSIFDKFGLPTGVANVAVKNTLPLRGYLRIYNDWFRDENLQNSIALPTGVGPDTQGMFALQKRGKRKDYFTGSLPTPQKGASVSLPLGTTAPVRINPTTGALASPLIRVSSTGALSGAIAAASFGVNASSVLANTGSAVQMTYDPNGSLVADLTTATAATINQLRLAFMTQSLLELDMRGGTRYVEILKSHFGVISPDFRLQRSEYLGGGSTRINAHPVAQTTPTAGSNPFAQLGAYSTAMVGGNEGIGFTKSFVEHGYIIGLACARADLTYQQGINRLWLKSTRYDFFWPKFQELGEQTVFNQEIYCNPADGLDNNAFGYQERYAEYKYRPSEIHGEFRSTFATPLDMWHMAENFASRPLLNSTFIVQNTPVARAIAVPTAPHLLLDCWFDLTSARPMLVHSVPANLGRF